MEGEAGMSQSYPIDPTWDPPMVTTPGVACFVLGDEARMFGLDRHMPVRPEWFLPKPRWSPEKIKSNAATTLTTLVMRPADDPRPMW